MGLSIIPTNACRDRVVVLKNNSSNRAKMYTKALIVTALVAFLSVQLANSLTCYTCTTPGDCKKPSKVTCTNLTANTTSHYLSVHHQNVANITGSSRFDCLALKYSYNKNVVHQLHGCIHPNVNACGLYLKPAYGHWNKDTCHVCSGNKCNKNPAGTMSSSVYTIVATALGLMLAKVYA